MHIAPPPFDAAFCEAQVEDLRLLIAQPDDRQARPCPGCDIACPTCGSKACTCNCRPSCPDAPQRLSSDPERFPVERGIAPLVYAFSSLRVLPPCWSFEGHLGADGQPLRLPSVWFFARKLGYPGLVAELLARLKGGRHVSHDWQVTTLGCGLEADWCFAVEPRPAAQVQPELPALQQDAQAIAGRLGTGVRAIAASHLERLRRNIGTGS